MKAKALLILFLIYPVCAFTQQAGSLQDPIYSKPLRFDVLGDGIELKPLVLDYDLTSQKSLIIANTEFSDKTYYWKFILENGEYKLFGFWPEVFIQDGIVEIVSKTGRVLWKREINKKAFLEWRADKQQSKNEWAQKSLVVISGLTARDPIFQIIESFKICFSKTVEGGQNRLCTRLYELRKNKAELIFVPVAQTPAPARVIAYNETWPLKNTKVVTLAKPLQFFAELSTGATYEFVAKPIPLNLVEMVQTDGNQYRIVAWGPHPNIAVRDINLQIETYFVRLLGWQSTIGDFREFWEVTRNMNETQIGIPGDGGGVFLQDYTILHLPTEKVRPWADVRTISGTYSGAPKVFGKKAKSTRVSSTQASLDMNSSDSPDEFTWRFQANERGEINKSYLMVAADGRTYKTYTEIFKGYPREISARTSVILTEGSPVIMGEVAFNYWFEDILGWSQYYISRQRWGISAKYFQSITNLVFKTYDAGFTSSTIDLKYRFNPGLWGRDETWGLIVGTNTIKYDLFAGQFMGVGVFWARSMPRIFDEWMNAILPLFRYPKWVDMEFIYYGTSMTGGVTAYTVGQSRGTGNWALNFHGKLMWTKQFFGEAGFGMKVIDIKTINNLPTTPPTSQLGLNLTTFYGTAGLGWSF